MTDQHDESAFFTSEQRSGVETAAGTEGFLGESRHGEPVPGGPGYREGFTYVAVPTVGSEGKRGPSPAGSAVPPLGAAHARDQSQGGQSVAGSGNFGLARRAGNRRVVGVGESLVTHNGDGSKALVRSYKVSNSLQFNQVEELQPDAISRSFAQEIIESLFAAWSLNTGDAVVMRKAEDVLFAFLVVRGASPFADYDLPVLIGGKEVNLSDLSNILKAKEIQRRRFSRALADDLRTFIRHPENVILRDRIQTKLAVFPQYGHLAFDGSTHCTGMNRNEVAFTKALESRNLFDDESVKGSLKGSSLLDGVFDTRR